MSWGYTYTHSDTHMLFGESLKTWHMPASGQCVPDLKKVLCTFIIQCSPKIWLYVDIHNYKLCKHST